MVVLSVYIPWVYEDIGDQEQKVNIAPNIKNIGARNFEYGD